MHPRAFISHASEDKERFVLDFATRLRAKGIDAWVDRWEMLPGDSLVQRIFEEGLKDAQAVVIVLSQHSVEKPWVRQEIDTAFVNRINRGCKLVPVVIDECKVPECLTSTLWERVNNLSSYDTALDRIVAAISGVREKPPLGSLPAYATAQTNPIDGLAKVDNTVLKTICEIALKAGHSHVDGGALIKELSSLPRQELDDALEILESSGLIGLTHYIGREPPAIKLRTLGFQKYGFAYLPEYETIIHQVASAIVNEKLYSNEELEVRLSKPRFIIDHALDVLETQGYLEQSKYLSGRVHIPNVSATLRRSFGG